LHLLTHHLMKKRRHDSTGNPSLTFQAYACNLYKRDHDAHQSVTVLMLSAHCSYSQQLYIIADKPEPVNICNLKLLAWLFDTLSGVCYSNSCPSRPDGRARDIARGKSELHRAGCWITSRRGDPTAECNREQTAGPPAKAGSPVRVKRRCKRPPAIQVTGPAR
jgi:hypothetical protein